MNALQAIGGRYANIARQVVARVAGETNSRLLGISLAIAGGAILIIVGMLGWYITIQNSVIEQTRSMLNENRNRLTAIETRLGRIESDVRELRND